MDFLLHHQVQRWQIPIFYILSHVAGGSIEGEELDSWRETSGEQQPAESDVGKEVIIAHPGSSTEDGEPAESDAAPEELEKLTRENREALEGIRRVVGKPTAGGSSPRTDFTNEDKLQELDRLVAMAKALGEMTVSAAWTLRRPFYSICFGTTVVIVAG